MNPARSLTRNRTALVTLLLVSLALVPAAHANHDGDDVPDVAEEVVCGSAPVAGVVNNLPPEAGRCVSSTDYEPSPLLTSVNVTPTLQAGEDGRYGAGVVVTQTPAATTPPATIPWENRTTDEAGAAETEIRGPAGVANVTVPGVTVGATSVTTSPDNMTTSHEGASSGAGFIETSQATISIFYPVQQDIVIPAQFIPIPEKSVSGENASADSPAVERHSLPPPGSQSFIATLFPVTGGATPTVTPAGSQDVLKVGIGDVQHTISVPRYTVALGGSDGGVILDLNGEAIPLLVFIPAENATVPDQGLSLFTTPVLPDAAIDPDGEQLVTTVTVGDINETVHVPRHRIHGGGSDAGLVITVNGEETRVLAPVPAFDQDVPL